MKQTQRTHRQLLLTLGLAACGTLAGPQVLAQQAPDAGALLKEQPRPPAPAATPLKLPKPLSTENPFADTGPKILVKAFRIKGALLVAEADLQAQLKEAVGKELSFAQLQELTQQLSGYYAQRGYLARIVLPPQEIKDGIVDVQIIEGSRGGININNPGQRIDNARVRGYIDHRLPLAAPMDLARLGEAMDILNEQPGIDAKATLAPGKEEAATDIVVTVAEKPLAKWTLGANNAGSFSTGEYQVQGSLSLDNPSGHFDQAALTLNASDGTTYARADYSVPIGTSGLRVGINVSDLAYKLTHSSFSALQAKGSARSQGLVASYPLKRGSALQLDLTAALDDKELQDRTIAGETGNRQVTVITLGIGGKSVLDSPANTVISFGANLVTGRSDQRNAAALATDATTRQVQGHFTKLGLNAGWLQPLKDDWSANLALRGQLAGKNLDSSERFTLGGPNGVRAYPVGEGTGDEGLLLSATLTKKIDDALSANLFLDSGVITVNRRTWAAWNAGNPRLKNNYALSGLGAGLDWRPAPNVLLTFSIAAPLGQNPGRDTSDRNADTSPQGRIRAWISLKAQF